MALDVRVDPARCIGSRTCVNRAPGVFRLDDTGVAVVVDPEAAPEEAVLDAAADCPTAAILVAPSEDERGA